MGLTSVQIYNLKQQKKYAEKSGFNVDIQNIGHNTQTVALREKKTLKEIYDGVWLSTDALELEDGNFSNIYNLSWSSKNKKLTPVIHSARKPYYLRDCIRDNPSMLAIMNGSFFFLVEVGDRTPKDYPFHFCVRDGKVIGLPSSDEPIIFTRGEKLFAKEPSAIGSIKLGKHIIRWVGAQSKLAVKSRLYAKLYNSGSAKLIKQFDPVTKVRRGILDEASITTPKEDNLMDIVVNEDKNGILRISNIVYGGGCHFFDGLMILQMKIDTSKFKIGDRVTPLTLDGMDLYTVKSGLSVHKGVRDRFFYTPERVSSRDARSAIAEDVHGNIHFIVFDGCKYIPKFKGVSAKDISSYFSPRRYKWAYFLDGGSSSRIIVKDGKEYRYFGSEFAFKKVTEEIFKWDWKAHRKLGSSIALKIRRN